MNQNSGFNQMSDSAFNNLNGNNNNPNTLTQQPSLFQLCCNHAKFTGEFDYQWYDKPSQDGEFKYGLCDCCNDASQTIHAITAILGCLIPFPFCIAVANLNGEVADVVGNMRAF